MRSTAQGFKRREGPLGLGTLHENVIMVVAGDDVGAEPMLGQAGGEGGGQAHRVETRMHLQRDTTERAVERYAGLLGTCARHYQR